MAFGQDNLRRRIARLAAAAIAVFCLFALPVFAQARVAVTGIPAAFNDEMRRLLREEPNPASLFEAQRQADRASEIVSRLLESEGYYAAEVEPWAEGVDTFTRGVRVTTGPLFTYASRRIDFIGPPPDETTQRELESLLDPIAVGAPAQAEPVIQAGDALVARLKAAGYPDARAQPVDALADGRENTVELAYKLQPGLRYSFGQLQVSGLGRTRQEFIDRLKPWGPNERYSTEKMDEFRARLAETGLFDSAAASLAETPAPAAPSATQTPPAPRDVVVEVTERKRRTVAAGASASTSEGLGVEAEWELRNLTGRGDAVNVKGQVATLERRLETTYRRPHIGRYGRNVQYGAKIEDFETDAFDQTGGSVSASIEDRLTPRVRGSVGVEAGFASIADDKTRAAGTGRRDLYILSGSATAEYIGVRDLLDPQEGIRARVAVEPGVTYGDDNIGFTKLSGEASLYGELGDSGRLVGAVRGRIGTIVGPEGAPPDRLFYAGGGGSVRGYEYQSLSPRDASNVPIGGRSLVELSAELRWRQNPRLGYVAFLDAGAAGSNVEPPIDQMKAGVGFGVRYYAGFGPLRADIAIPLNKRTGDADFQIYISIGQAF